VTINIVIILVIFIGVLSGIKACLKRISGTGCCGSGNQSVRIEPEDKRRSHYAYRAELVVQGMKCRNCVLLVENALNSLDGVMAKVNLKKSTVSVLLKQTGNEQMLTSAVSNAGYTVTDIRLFSR
jgi:copper chaperone